MQRICDKGLVDWPCCLLDRRSSFLSLQNATHCHALRK